MGMLPAELMAIIGVFAPLFAESVWWHVQVLLGGAILAPGKRTVTSILRVIELGGTGLKPLDLPLHPMV